MTKNEYKDVILKILIDSNISDLSIMDIYPKIGISLEQCYYLCKEISNEGHIHFIDCKTEDGYSGFISTTDTELFLNDGGYSNNIQHEITVQTTHNIINNINGGIGNRIDTNIDNENINSNIKDKKPNILRNF
jgi:hypothetical protein